MLVRVLFLLSTLLTIYFPRSGHAWKDRSFAPAQCTAKCLRDFALAVSSTEKHKNDTRFASLKRSLMKRPDIILSQCKKEGSLVPSCRSCVRACETFSRSIRCTDKCKKDGGCLAGCQYLQQAIRVRPGSCPKSAPAAVLSGARKASCFRSCASDADCRVALQKCCPSGCGSVCSAAVYNSSIPKFDHPLRIWEHAAKHKIDVQWRYKTRPYRPTDFLRPTVFVVQIRDYRGMEFNDRFARSWHTLLTTTYTAAEVDDVNVGTWYQFRIAAVTATGTRGFLKMSTPVRLSVTPRAPTAPRNVSDGVWRIHAGGSVNVQINWAPPEISDFPISRYQVEWVQDHGYVQSDGKSLEAFTRFKQFVPGDRTSYTIEGLLPATSYKVQITAQARWGRAVLKSPPNTLFVTTPPMRSEDTDSTNLGKKLNLGEDGRCVCDTKTPDLFIYKPVYQNGSLDVKILLTQVTTIDGDSDPPYLVEWSPKVCIATSEEARLQQIGGRKRSTMQNRYKVIRDLAFNCRYWLRVTPLVERPRPERIISTCFCTPACRDVNTAKRSAPPKCSPDTSVPVPSRPTNILARKVGHRAFALTWARPKRARRFNRFRVIWGPREEEPVNKDMYGDSGLSPKIDSRLEETKVVPNNVTSLLLKNLRDATMYIVKIQALSVWDGKESESPEGVLYFTTDGFTNPPTVEDYQAVVSQYVKNGRGNGISTVAPFSRLSVVLIVLLHFVLLRDCT